MRIQANIAALNSKNRLKLNQSSTTKTLEKLSSGYKLNRAADDAAGLTISEGMRAQIRGLKRAALNAQDGLSYVQTTDGVVQGVTSVVHRMRELTVQALNDTVVEDDRKAIQEELETLKKHIANVSENSVYNDTLKSIEVHEASFGMLTGNAQFDGPITIKPGLNDTLTFIAEGVETTITIPSGTYESIDNLVDELDTILMDKNPNIILDVTDDHYVSVQIENSKDIAKIKGTGSFLFYEYELGNQPGMIIGTTNFLKADGSEGALQITAGENDEMSLYVGPTTKVNLKLDPGTYTRQQVIDELNTQLAGTGAVASKYGASNIAISSDKHVITGLSGNMLEIDGITSILYDIADYGEVRKTQGFYYGSEDVTSGVTIDQTNNLLTISANTVEGNVEQKTINLLNNGETSISLTSSDLVARLQEKLDIAQFDVKVEISGSSLKITSNYMGNGSRVSVSEGSTAYDILFKKEGHSYYNPHISNGLNVPAALVGNYKDRSEMTIETGINDIFKLKVDGIEQQFILPNGTYTIDEIKQELESQIVNKALDLEVIISEYGGREAFSFRSYTHSLQFVSGGAFDTLLGGESISYPSIIQGHDGEPVYPPEGTVGEVVIEKYSATATGQVDISSGLQVTDDNNTLSFTLNGTTHNVQLDNNYYSKTSLIEELNVKLAGKGVTASEYAGKLMLTTTDKGTGVTLSNVTGLGMERFYTTSPSTTYTSEPIQNRASLTAFGTISTMRDTVEVEEGQNSFQFTYTHNATTESPEEYSVSFEVLPGTYSKSDFLTALKSSFEIAVEDAGIADFVQLSTTSQISLSTTNAGADYLLSDFGGELYKEVFSRYDYELNGYGYSGVSSPNDPAYIVGRQELPDTIEIFPSNNDVLTFDLTYMGVQHTIDVQVPPNTYTKQGFVSAFNTELKKVLVEKGLPEDAVRAQIGAPEGNLNVSNQNKFTLMVPVHDDGRNDNGVMKVEGVRGSGAYTYFYFSQGEASPSHVVGIVDLSGGVKIEEGVNDELSIDVDDVTKTMTFPAGEYSADEFLLIMNDALTESNSGLIASYDNGRMKFSYRENGPIPIDGLSGSARDYLFFKTDRRDNQDPLSFQIGANENQNIDFKHITLSENLLRINTLDIQTRKGADKALQRFDQAIEKLSERTGLLGAMQNRLEHTINVNLTTSENLTAAESRIRDADVAKEMMKYTKQNILVQAAQSMLAQANKVPEAIVELLK